MYVRADIWYNFRPSPSFYAVPLTRPLSDSLPLILAVGKAISTIPNDTQANVERVHNFLLAMMNLLIYSQQYFIIILFHLKNGLSDYLGTVEKFFHAKTIRILIHIQSY